MTVPVISPASLPNGIEGLPYLQLFTVAGGTAPYSWSHSGPLPPGLLISSSTGAVTDESSANVSDEGGSVVEDESLTNDALEDEASFEIDDESGFTIDDELQLQSIILSGIPTVAGTYTFAVTVQDNAGQIATVIYSVIVTSSLDITTTSLPSGSIGVAYSQSLSAINGSSPYTWTLGTGSSLPSGLTLSPAGVISGAPVNAGSVSFLVVVTDNLGSVASAILSISVGGVPVPGPIISDLDPVTAEWLDSSLASQGFIPFTTLSAVLYYNFVGSWQMTVPYSDQMWEMAKSGDFIVSIDWKGLFSFGGKCEQPGYQFAAPTSSQAGAVSQAGDTITLMGADYLALIANRIAYPDPTKGWGSQSYTAADTVANVPCETAIKHYVSRNAGNGSLGSRQITLMDVATDAARGGRVSYSAKLTSGVDLNLMDIVRDLIGTGGPMGVSMKRNGRRLLFDTYIPRDLTDTAWFSRELGNLTSAQLSLTDPTTTEALVYGQSAFVAVGSATSQWKLIEQLVDQSSETSATALTQAGNTALADGAAGPALAVMCQDIPMLTFGRDYGLGDKVTGEIRPGDTYQDIIASVAITVDPTQPQPELIVPSIGYASDPGKVDPSFAAQLASRVRRLERRLDAQRG